MPRMRYPSIRAIAEQALRDVAAEDQVKTAEAQVLRGVLAPPAPPKTELAAELQKLAAECRQQTGEVTYEDLRRFIHAE